MMESDERPVAAARLTRRATAPAAAEALRWATMFAAEHGMEGRRLHDLAIAVSEAVTNAVLHAYEGDEIGDVLLAIAADGEWLTVRVEDRGRGIEQASSSGLGLGLMIALADRTEVGRSLSGYGTTVMMEFPIADASRPAERLAFPEQVSYDARLG